MNRSLMPNVFYYAKFGKYTGLFTPCIDGQLLELTDDALEFLNHIKNKYGAQKYYVISDRIHLPKTNEKEMIIPSNIYKDRPKDFKNIFGTFISDGKIPDGYYLDLDNWEIDVNIMHPSPFSIY